MIIEVTDLHKSFGDHEVLSGIDFTVADGEVVCIIGPSGSGKSTFLRCLNLLEDVTSGEVVIDGQSLTDKRVKIDQVRTEIGMVFQQRSEERRVGKEWTGRRRTKARRQSRPTSGRRDGMRS